MLRVHERSAGIEHVRYVAFTLALVRLEQRLRQRAEQKRASPGERARKDYEKNTVDIRLLTIVRKDRTWTPPWSTIRPVEGLASTPPRSRHQHVQRGRDQ